ncbi:MAG: hypothetical protein SFW65_05245 [Alphaproteobacteria bacterium]|nr:hypothetical protein [Alphaproteobacteria bacterium]
MVMDTVTDAGTATTHAGKKPDILAWFDWAERLTTGLGTKSELNVIEENNFDAVLLSAVAALHANKPGVHLPEQLQADLDRTGVAAPQRLVVNSGSAIAVETITLFMLERLATRDDERAFELAEDLRIISRGGVFANQLALFQMSLADINPDLNTRNFEPWGDKADHLKVASAQRLVKPDSFEGQAVQSANRVMQSYFKAPVPRLDAA